MLVGLRQFMITTSEMDVTGTGGDAIREGAGQEDAPGGTQTR
jgi:hypothetical protein